MGLANQPVIDGALDYKDCQRGRKRELWGFRDLAGGEYKDNCKEIKKVVVDQLKVTRVF